MLYKSSYLFSVTVGMLLSLYLTARYIKAHAGEPDDFISPGVGVPISFVIMLIINEIFKGKLHD